jgi:mono/diheme cytochrome c family protein
MDTLKRVVNVVQVLTLFAAVSFVLLLFVNEPAEPASVPQEGTEDAGETLFATRCSSCHAPDGSGGFGPPLAGVVTERFPDPAAEVAVVADGLGSMPSFSDSLTPEQIEAVVEFTRTGL